ncbi:hypothetical protein HZH68_005579 [Vespula germanica]|uniref:Uncharacterized protein n=1 Tax=Vespula germanica TaxID=30212 RepID=A0A834KGH0_VESGE|nr:hypothetical protein HZH68_005579 [Vespula germanica]
MGIVVVWYPEACTRPRDDPKEDFGYGDMGRGREIRTHARQLISVQNESGRIILLCTVAFIKPAHGVEDDDGEDGDGKSGRDGGGV